MILSRIYWFLSWSVLTAVAVVIVFLILRLVANQIDLNPFGSSSITIRRLTDPLIMPVRRALLRVGVDPKYAPLITILAVILLGWFALQLLSAIANTFAGLFVSVREKAPIATLGYVLYGLLGLYSLLIFVRIIFSWGLSSYRSRFSRFLTNSTEPLLGPLRRMIPTVGMFDISPIVAFVIIWVLQGAIAGTLLRGWPVIFFG
ncbi:MAG TPA: YggT family protein [Pyrinomonadaceae bacterium]|nr:YggT family protein [Pyrinomonadaceae bacterium]